MGNNKSVYLDLMGITSWRLRSKTGVSGGKEKELLSNIFKALNVTEESKNLRLYSLREMLLYPELKTKFWQACLSEKLMLNA